MLRSNYLFELANLNYSSLHSHYKHLVVELVDLFFILYYNFFMKENILLNFGVDLLWGIYYGK